MGRRINKKVSNSGPLNTEGAGDFFYYDGNRLLEHHHDSPTSGEDYLREYVWGLEYIDEAVAQYDTEPGQAAELFFILIDANYNVVAITDDTGDLVQQYSYWPYGTLQAVEDCKVSPPGDLLGAPALYATNLGHQGLYWDFESWLVHNRARTYNPDLGRFMQRDPNETALLFVTALMRNGQAQRLIYTLSPGDQYGDGMNFYEYLRSNPIDRNDPSGLLIGFHRFVADVVGSAIAAYAFGLDAGVYALLEEGPASADFDRAIKSIPYSVGGAFAGGAVAFAFRWSSTGNILGGSVAGGLSTFGLGEGFLPGALIGGGISAAFEVAFKALGRWRTGAVVGSGATGGATGWRSFMRILRGRGLLNWARQKAIIPLGTRASNIPGKWPAAIAPRTGKVYVQTTHQGAIQLAQEGAATKAGIRSGWVELDDAGGVIWTRWEKTW